MVKRNAVCALIAALVALLLPWLAVTLVRGDGGMAVCFLLFFAVNPVTAILLGVFSGRNIRGAWFQPLLFAALFLLGTWVFFTMAETAFVRYAVIYLLLGYAAMLLAVLCGRIKKTVSDSFAGGSLLPASGRTMTGGFHKGISPIKSISKPRFGSNGRGVVFCCHNAVHTIIQWSI